MYDYTPVARSQYLFGFFNSCLFDIVALFIQNTLSKNQLIITLNGSGDYPELSVTIGFGLHFVYVLTYH